MTTNGDDGSSSSWDEARQLGQLFMMGFDGTSVNDQVKVLIEKYHVGSILLTAKNLKSAEQATQLVLDLQTLAHNSGHANPLLIVIDQENGGVNSLYDESFIRQFPSAMGVAATGSKQMAKYVSRATAQELAACGVNWILGPVMDVLTNAKSQPIGVRSFGDDPQEVSAYAGECIKGYQEGGIATCGKHFPSYGNLEFFGAPTDVPTITDSLEHLSQSALVPFRNAIAQGVDAMMVGGVALSSSGLNVMHACLSEQVVRDLLRHEMRFDGVVVSECLEMEALSKNIGISGGTVMAVNAGCDIILTCRNLSVQEEAINGLRAGLDNGMIERFRIQESVRRVLSLKSRYTSWEKAFAPPGIEHLSRLQPMHNNLSTSAYNKSVTVVRDQNAYLPLSKTINEPDELLLLTPLVQPIPTSAAYRSKEEGLFTNDWDFTNGANHSSHSALEASVVSGEMVFRQLGRALARQRKGKVSHASYTANGVRPTHENLISRASAVIIVTADAGRNLYQYGFTKHISTLCKIASGPGGQRREIPCIVVAVSSPFDFVSESSIGTYLCTYDFTETALQALVRILYGEQSASGTLPGTASHTPKTMQSRQQWLVEAFNQERDMKALSNLIKAVQNAKPGALLQYANADAFLLNDSEIEETHFVVRNSTTKELFGFCATYSVKSSKTGHIGAVIVDPARRRLSIGRSLHDRAMRALSHMKSVQHLKLGSRFPNVLPGIPNNDPTENRSLREWFTRLGWNMKNVRSVHSMQITDLNTWSPPEGLGKTLSNPDIKYDLVHGAEYFDVITNHAQKFANSDVQAMYRIALNNKEGCAIIRAKRSSDGAILGTVVLFRGPSKLAPYIPAIQNPQVIMGGLSYPVISKSAKDQVSLVQGLMLLGTRQLKKQGIQRVLLEYVDDNSLLKHFEEVGFTGWQSFEEVSSELGNWTMMPP